MSSRLFSQILILSFLAYAGLSSQGCAKDEKFPEPTGGASSPSTDPDSESGGSDTLGFFVKIDDSKAPYPYFMSKAGNFGTTCNIPASTTAGQKISCIMDVMEYDLNYHGGGIKFGAPADMCDYIQEKTPWFWTHSVGIGPSEIVENITTDAEGNVTAFTCTARNTRFGTMQNCTGGHPEIQAIDESSLPVCVYNHNYSDQSKPNCCFGKYNLTINRTVDGVVAVPETSVNSWGEPNYGACISSAMTDNGKVLANGAPANLRHFNAKGADIPRAISTNLLGPNYPFSFQSTYYKTDTSHNHTGYFATGSSTLPYAFDPINDLDGSLMSSLTGKPVGRSALSLLCYDGAGEVKHQIDFYTREWNTKVEFLAYKTSSGASGNPDLGGTANDDEGTTCDYSNGFDSDCNDYWDFDDILTNVGGSYDVSTPNAATRSSWFPNIIAQ